MSVLLRRLCRNTKKDFRINLVAGADGLDNMVDWVHIIEDKGAAEFLRGHELVFTTGIGNLNDVNVILEFVQEIHNQGASGLMLNLGPYITEVPKTVINYCNENNFPLFTIPWEQHLVDVTRHFCQIIIEEDEKTKSRTSLVKDFILKPGERDSISIELMRQGFSQHSNYCVMNIGLIKDKEKISDSKSLESLRESIERNVNKITSNFVIFRYLDNYIVVTEGVVTSEVENFVTVMSEKHIADESNIYVAVSSNRGNLMSVPQNFELSEKVYKLCLNLNEPVLYYDKLGIYKILLSVPDKKLMKDYEKNVLGVLREYDESNGSDYCEFIKIFIENNANIQQVAKSMFVHRNTIHYKINRIKEATGLDLTQIDDLLKLKLCFLIDKI